jgi:hypothetical protein
MIESKEEIESRLGEALKQLKIVEQSFEEEPTIVKLTSDGHFTAEDYWSIREAVEDIENVLGDGKRE